MNGILLLPSRRRCIGLLVGIILLLLTGGCAVSSAPLIKASADGDLKAVKALVESGALLDAQDCASGWDYVCCTAITCAANKGHVNVVKYLVEHGVDVNTVDDNSHYPGNTNWTPLHYAALRGNLNLVYYLLDQGADLSATTSSGITPLQITDSPEVKAVLAAALQKQYAGGTEPASGSPPPSRLGAAAVGRAPISSELLSQIPAGLPAGRYDVAVVIGNADYSSTGTPNVDYALQDASAMRQYLVKAFGFDPANIIYLENASLAKMTEVFGTDRDYQGKLYKWVKPGRSRIFVYYVGHGAPDQQTGDGYFVPVDANPQYISTSGYKLSTFYANLERIPATKKTVVIDACFSGSSARGQLLRGVSGLTARLRAEPKAAQVADQLLTSAEMDQVASWYPEKGHSLFTYFFLKGIQGEADVNRDGHLTLGEMRAYLNDQVPYLARRLTGNDQRPVLIGDDSDDLIAFVR